MIGKGVYSETVKVSGRDVCIAALSGKDDSRFWELYGDKELVDGETGKRRALAFGLFKCCTWPDGGACYQNETEPLAENSSDWSDLRINWLRINGLLAEKN